jgi:hypothetical protein
MTNLQIFQFVSGFACGYLLCEVVLWVYETIRDKWFT